MEEIHEDQRKIQKRVCERARERKEEREREGSTRISHTDCQTAFQFPLVGERVEWDRFVLCEETRQNLPLPLPHLDDS